MEHPTDPLSDPALTLGLALAVGMLVQAMSRHLRLPGIVLLLAAGVLLGPDGLGWVRPENLGSALQTLVGFAVAIILFEGGMSLKISALRREGLVIRRLVTIGAVATAVGGALAARFILQWDWVLSALFGTLVIVTGPTVVNPLMKRIRVRRKVSTVLEAEGVFIDAIGAIAAVVALELVLSPGYDSLEVMGGGPARLGLGLVLGLAGGTIIAVLLRWEGVVPEGLENVFTLSLVVALFQISNSLLPESGIASVTVAGLLVGNVWTPATTDLRDFKEQLTVMLIGLLFVLLAADVRLAEVQALGLRGLLTVLALVVVVRPLCVLVSTFGSDYDWRERAFLAWIAPRGIVAAAVTSLFAVSLDQEGIPGGNELRAMVFLVIASTVLLAGLTGGLVARLLGLRPPAPSGYVLLGANPLALALAGALRRVGSDVLLIDSNPAACRDAEEAGFKVLYGSGLDERVLGRAELEYRAGAMGVTTNDNVNFTFSRRARREYRVPRAWAALRRDQRQVREDMMEEAGSRTLFERPRNLERWQSLLRREGAARSEAWRRVASTSLDAEAVETMLDETEGRLLPLVVDRRGRSLPVDETTTLREGDVLYLLLPTEDREQLASWLQDWGFAPVSLESTDSGAVGAEAPA